MSDEDRARCIWELRLFRQTIHELAPGGRRADFTSAGYVVRDVSFDGGPFVPLEDMDAVHAAYLNACQRTH